jgi:release factor glutamine methyltransferase
MLLREIKNIFHTELDQFYSKEEVDSFFYILIEHQLDLKRFVLATEPNLVIAKKDQTPLFAALSRLKLLEPIQHITGTTHFMEMDFMVSKDVLIPRPETEELVRWIIEMINIKFKIQNDALKILDIGTGSGCIAISLAKHLKDADVYALDVSELALAVAKTNASVNEVDITFLKDDVLDLESLNTTYDIIVSNPPYVRELEKSKMHKNVLAYEPSLALFVSDDYPLRFYKKITTLAEKHLKKKGTLYFEINQYLGKETKQLLRNYNFSEIELRTDMYGNERMLKGTLN